MSKEFDTPEITNELEQLRQRAYKFVALKAGPWEIPSFKTLRVPGIWGGRTMPLTLPPNPRTGNLESITYLAQQFPSMAIMLIVEDIFGLKQVIHNFNPEVALIDRLNKVVNIQGDTKRQDIGMARWLLDFIESGGQYIGEAPLTPIEGPFNF